MKYIYFMELRGQQVALLETHSFVRSPKELYRKVVNDPVNFQRVYGRATPNDVFAVLRGGDVFEFLLCGDLNFFRKWLRSEILRKNYRCFLIQNEMEKH